MKKFFFLTGFMYLFFCGCNRADDHQNLPADSAELKDTIENKKVLNEAGFVGVFDVPEMLCISKLDSADIKDVSAKIARDYRLLQDEIKKIDAITDGPAGQINYNNDPHNFKFECIQLIRSIPKKEPADCKIVVLEASKMLIYNYYGPYQQLHTAYKKMQEYCKANRLEQSGPQREFYVTDPTTERDPVKWLTRIMLPVAVKK